MRAIEQIESDIAEIERRIEPMRRDKQSLVRELRRAKSIAWIKANNVTRDQVQLSSGDNIPWHSHCEAFATWLLQTKCEKRFCEWNGTLFFTAEMKTGYVDFSKHPGKLEDVPS